MAENFQLTYWRNLDGSYTIARAHLIAYGPGEPRHRYEILNCSAALSEVADALNGNVARDAA